MIKARCFLVIVLLFALGVGLSQSVRGVTAGGMSSRVQDIEIFMEGWPKLTAPFAEVPMRWYVGGGLNIERTCVFWDTVSRPISKAYRYRTAFQTWKQDPGYFHSTSVTVPADAEAIYMRPYAVVDGQIAWGEETAVAITRALNCGSQNARLDTDGLWWFSDREMAHQYYGFVDGYPSATSGDIAGTEDDWLYQSQRRDIAGVGCWLNSGYVSMEIEVQFRFAEWQAMSSGERVFDIRLEPGSANEVLIPNVDVYDAVGHYAAHVITQTVRVSDDQLDIVFEGKTGLPPILNGVVMRGVSGIPQQNITKRVLFSDDDTYVEGTSNFRDSPELLAGANERYHIGARFFGLSIPQGATIQRARLYLTSSESVYKNMTCRIHADDTDDSEDFRIGELVTDRPRTAASAVWSVTSDQGWVVGREYSSPELTGLIQEVVNRPGWTENNAISLLLIAEGGDTVPHKVYAVEGSADFSPRIEIDFVPAGGGPTPAPTLTFTPIPSVTPTPTRTAIPSITPTATSTPPGIRILLPVIYRLRRFQ